MGVSREAFDENRFFLTLVFLLKTRFRWHGCFPFCRLRICVNGPNQCMRCCADPIRKNMNDVGPPTYMSPRFGTPRANQKSYRPAVCGVLFVPKPTLSFVNDLASLRTNYSKCLICSVHFENWSSEAFLMMSWTFFGGSSKYTFFLSMTVSELIFQK